VKVTSTYYNGKELLIIERVEDRETMIKINALGDPCPLPVIKAKRALGENTEIVIAVDNEIATQNLKKMGAQLGFQVEIIQESEKVYHVLIRSATQTTLPPQALQHEDSRRFFKEEETVLPYIVVMGSRAMGVGSDELGQTLLKAFIYSLTEQDVLPTHLLFYNEGAKLTTDLSPVLQDLETLKKANVEILTCGACLDYFNLTEKLAVGEVTNMFHIVELMSKYHVVRP